MDPLYALNIIYAVVAILYYLDMLVRKNAEQPLWTIFNQNQTFSKKLEAPTKTRSPQKLN